MLELSCLHGFSFPAVARIIPENRPEPLLHPLQFFWFIRSLSIRLHVTCAGERPSYDSHQLKLFSKLSTCELVCV